MFARDQYRFHCEPGCMLDSWFCVIVIATRAIKPCGRGQSEFPSRGRFDRLEEAIRRAVQWVNGHRADNRN